MDPISSLPAEIRNMVFRYLSMTELVSFRRISRSWQQCLSVPEILRDAALEYALIEDVAPEDDIHEADQLTHHYIAILRRIHAFRHFQYSGGSVEIPLALEAEPITDTTEEIYRQYAFSSGQLLMIEQSRPWSHLKVQEIGFEQDLGDTIWSVDEKTYINPLDYAPMDFKCSRQFLVCCSEGLIWDRQDSRQHHPTSLRGDKWCRFITVSDEVVVALDESHLTIWNAHDKIIKRIRLALRSDIDWSDYSAMLEPDHKTLLALFYDVESGIMIIQRYNMEGHLLNCDEADLEVERPMLQEDEGEMFKRQPDGTYIVKCVYPYGPDSEIAFIYFDPRSFRLFEKTFRVPWWNGSICSVLLRWQTVYCCSEEGGLFALALEDDGQWGTKTKLRAILPLRRSSRDRLFGDDRLVLEVMNDACHLFWFN